MMMILSRWRLKSINSDVPLYDATNRTYGVIVGGDFVEVPEALFLKLFERIETPRDLGTPAMQIPPWQGALAPSIVEQIRSKIRNKDSVERMKAAILFFKNLGMTKEEVMDTLGVAAGGFSPEVIARLGREIELMYDKA